jgi:hypothetical protein
MCTGDFKVCLLSATAQRAFVRQGGALTRCCQEAKEGKINLDNDEPEAVEAMLHYMYHGSYVDPGNAPQDIAPILLDVRMFIIADKYFIKPLKSVTRAKFAQHCADEWKSADFALAIREIYATELSDTSVKDIAIKTIREHTGEFFTDRDTYEGIHKAMRDIPAFGADVLGELAATKYDFGNLLKWKLKCPNCQSDFYVGVPAANSNFRFSCPKGDNINQTISWWSSYRIQ